MRSRSSQSADEHRRTFLKSCALAGGLSLPAILQQRMLAGEQQREVKQTAVIFVTMGGGPSQFETYDPKPNAPAEVRGVFRPIATQTPGFPFSELMPRQAAISDKLSIVRSIHHKQASHIAEHIVETGYDLVNSANSRKGEMPSMGSIVSKVRGVSPSGIPAYVSIPRHHAYAGTHWLGAQHAYFAVDDDPNAESFHVSNLKVSDKLDANRLDDRRALRQTLDSADSLAKADHSAEALDAIFDQAFNLISGERAQQAFDISRESGATRDRYGRNTLGQQMLLARRLVEAGVPFVCVRSKAWDDHEKLAEKISERAPLFDTGIAALIEDLHERGLSENVLVVAMGEFGRTPRINPKGGRDHWPAVMSVMISGGRYKMGRVIGGSDARGGAVAEAPYAPQNFLAMVYHHLGIDPGMTFPDYSGRPRYVLEERELIGELL